MAIVRQGTQTVGSSTATVVVSKPTGTADDIFIAVWVVSGASVADAAMTLPSGWTQVAYKTLSGGPTIKVAYKVPLVGGEPGSYTFTLASAQQQVAGIARYSGVDTSQVIDVAAVTSSGTGTTLTASDVVPVTDGALLLAYFAVSTPTGTTITPPAGFTAAITSSSVRSMLADSTQAAAGHSGDEAATIGTSAGWVSAHFALRPLDVGTTVTVSIGSVVSTSNLELSCTLVDDDLVSASSFRTTTLANMQGMFSRMVSFIGGFGTNDPLKDWNGVGAVPAIGSMYTNGIDAMYNCAVALGLPMDWIIWRLPWQFTENPNTGTDSTSADYYGTENRRIRADRAVDYQTYIRRIGKYLIQSKGARRFKVGSEMKGFQQDTMHSPAVSNVWDWLPYYNFYVWTRNALMLAADDAGVSRSLIEVGGPYPVTGNRGVANSSTWSTDTFTTETTPVETIRVKSATGDTEPFSLNNPGWGFPQKAALKSIPEFLKLCANNGVAIEMYCHDFGMYNNDNVVYNPDDFYVAAQRTRDYIRFDKQMLQTIAGGALAYLVNNIDITEYYLKAQSTISDTYPANTLLSDGSRPPGPYLPVNQQRPYIAAVKAMGLGVCVEEGVRSPSLWSPFGRGDGRTAPLLTGGQQTDDQRELSGAIASLGFPGAGTRTVIGDLYEGFSTHFVSGTPVRSATVSDTSKVYALASPTVCMVVNKTAGRKQVSINGNLVTLDPYETRFVTFGQAYTLTAATGTFTTAGSSANLLKGRKLSASAGSFGLTGQAANLLRGRRLPASAGSFTLTGQAANLRFARILRAQGGSFALTGFDVHFIHEPPYVLIGQTGVFATTGQDADLRLDRILSASAGSFTLTGQAANLLKGRLLTAAGGSFALTGQAANLLKGRFLSAAAGSFAVTGQVANLLRTRILSAATGSFELSGQAAALLFGRLLTGASGSFVTTGQAANLLRGRRLVADYASYLLTGQDAELILTAINHLLLSANTGIFTTTGADASLRFDRRLPAAVGSFVTEGFAALLLANRMLRAAHGTFVTTGLPAILTGANEVLPDTPVGRIFSVPSEPRIFTVEAEDRIYSVR